MQKELEEVTCKYCQKVFEAKRKWQKYCDSKCRWKYWAQNNPRIKMSPDKN